MKSKENAKLLTALGACLLAIVVLFVVMLLNMRPIENINEKPDDTLSGDTNTITIEEDPVQSIVVTIGEKKFKLNLANTAAAKEFAEATPFELDMSDLNGNEKYYYGESLPKAEYDVKTLHTGDLMLYGDDCIVLFYKDFNTTFRYTKLGKIEDPTGLAEALGSGDVTLIFTKQ